MINPEQFRQRAAARPMVCVTGGSGVASVLALLDGLCREGGAPDVTLFLAEAACADLHYMDELGRLYGAWPAPGRLALVPVLLEEPEGSGWGGLRGPVAPHVARYCHPALSTFCLCGPPAVVEPVLRWLGGLVEPAHLQYIITAPSAAASGSGCGAGWWA